MTIALRRGGGELIPALESLWNELFEHHLSVGAAGLPTIPGSESWPLRRAHYELLDSEPPGVSIWLAENAGSPAGYALAHEDYVSGARAQVLETLSVLPAARGAGLGSRHMDAVDAAALTRDLRVAAVDVPERSDSGSSSLPALMTPGSPPPPTCDGSSEPKDSE